jgi:hypothetical protein
MLFGDFFKITFNLTLSNNIFKMGLNYIDFYEQAKHIRGTQAHFTFYLWPLNSLLAILK